MLRTFDFIFQLQKDNPKRAEIYRLMASGNDEEMDISCWHLFFDHSRKWVIITNNGTDEYLANKFTPAEISYESLIFLIEPGKCDEKIEFEIRYV